MLAGASASPRSPVRAPPGYLIGATARIDDLVTMTP
jgi:hypothetical protein